MACQAPSVDRQGPQGRRQEIRGRHAHLQVRPDRSPFHQGQRRPQPRLRLHQVLEARRRDVLRGRGRLARQRRASPRTSSKLKIVDPSAVDPAPCLHGLRRAHVRPHREDRPPVLRPRLRARRAVEGARAGRRREFAAFVSSIIEGGRREARRNGQRSATACKKLRPRAVRLPVAAADGSHRDARCEGEGHAQGLTTGS